MLNFFRFGSEAKAAIGRWFGVSGEQRMKVRQIGVAQCFNADGSLAWESGLHVEGKNGVTTAGINNLLNVYFGATSKAAAWYMGLISNGSYTALASADTIASHAGWIEETSNYSQSTRPQWTPGSASGGAVSNSSSVDFTITGSVTVKGVFIVNENTKGGMTGTLWATALFTSGDQALVNGQTLKVTYTLSAT
jgi:hypothetical protein